MFTALIGPHFVDWASYRESFEREASAYIGRPVTVAGKASFRLLPTPVVSFTDIRVGDAAAPDVEMERFRAEVELTPLLKGEVRIIQMAVERPQFRIDIARLLGKEGALEGAWRLDPERISLERLQIIDGRALVNDSRTGRSWRAEGINAVVEADTLMGPGRLTADLVVDGRPIDLTVGFGRMAGNSISAKISAHSPDYPVRMSLDGTYHFPGAAPAKYDGVATVEGIPPKDAKTPRSPWADFRASGKFELAPSDLKIEEAKISYGAMERPLILEASGQLDFGEEPRFNLSIGARQIDVDRSLGGGAEKPVAIEAAFSALVEALPRVALPPLPGELHLEAQGVVVGGGVIQAVGVDLATAAGAWRVENFAAMLPGETRVDLNGTLGVATAPTFQGHARLASKRPTAFAAWWRDEVGSAAKISQFAVDADLDFGPDNQRLSNLVATTGAGTVTGAVDVRRFPQSEQLFVTVDLDADRADLVEARALAELLAGKSVDAGRIDQMTLSLRADVLSAGGVEARSVVVEGGFETGQLNIRRLSVADLAGARIDALGSIRDPFGKPSGSIEASISAADFRGAAEFLASFAPESRIAQHLKDVAPILSPVNAEVSAEGGAAGERLALSLTGSFADTHLTLEADGKGSLDDLASLAGNLTLHADGADSGEVLRQLGLNPLPVRSAPLKVDASFDGELASAGKLTLRGTVAGVDLDYAAETTLREGRVALAGTFKAASADIDPLLLLGGIAVPGVGEGHAASAAGRLEYSGDSVSFALTQASFAGQPVGGALQATFAPDIKLSGVLNLQEASLPFLAGFAAGAKPGVASEGWSDTPFAASVPRKVAIDLALSAATLDLGGPIAATDAKLDLALIGGSLNLDLVEAGFAGGILKGAIAASLHEGEAEVSLRGGLRGGELQVLAWEQAGLPAAFGKLDLSFEAIGRGRSMSGVVATLGGSGSFSIDEGRLNGLNAEALATVMAAAEGEKEPAEDEARETFARLFDSGALAFGRAAGSFSLSDGVMTIPTVSLADDATTILADATLDLNALRLASDWLIRAVGVGDAEAQPSVQLRFSGPIAEPARQIDLNPLLNRLRSRFLQRQLDELEVIDAERERAEAERKRTEAARQAAAELRDRDFGGGATATPAELTPPPEAAPAPELDPASVEIGPDLPPLQTAPPIDLVPDLRVAPPRRRSLPVAPVPAPIPPPPQTFESEYRLLPNGTIVKIR